MVLNHDQRVYSKIYIKDVFSYALTGDDLDKAVKIMNQLFDKHRMRMDIYFDLKYALEREFNIDKKIFYGVILKEIHDFLRTGLDHLDVFMPTDLDYPDNPTLNINRNV